MQPFSGRRFHRFAIARAYLAHGTLDVAVEQLIGVQVRRIAGQQEHLDALGVRLEPVLDRFCSMRRMPVNDQEDLAPRLLDQPLAEADERLGLEAPLEDHEAHLAAVGQCRDLV